MRFQLAAAKGKWFKGKHTASYLGLFLTFGLMGVWHGLTWHYIVYGMYHAVLLCGYDVFARWNKTAKMWGDGPWWRVLNIGITFHVIALGMLLFSGRLSPVPAPPFEAVIEEADSHSVSGYVWQKEMPVDFLTVDIYADHSWAARARCTLPRPDLRERGYGDGNIGFRAELPGYLRNGLSHIIEVRILEGNRLIGKPKMIPFPDEPYVPKPVPPVPPRAEPRVPAAPKR